MAPEAPKDSLPERSECTMSDNENLDLHDFSRIPGLSDLLTLGASGTISADRESLKIIKSDVSRRAGRPGTAAIDRENSFGKMKFSKNFDRKSLFSMILEAPGLSDGWYFEPNVDGY